MEKSETQQGGLGFGTLPVFLAGISTILGAVMFLRFGFAVGNVGLLGVLGIILLGHLVTVPTALAVAEIATNRRVEGGGEYFIISRSFGQTIGSVIGVSLFLSQAISVAFYLIAFAEAFTPVQGLFETTFNLAWNPRYVSVPATFLLLLLVVFKGAAMGVKALYVVVATLLASLVLFFLGSPVDGMATGALNFTDSVSDPVPFFVVFAICFPAFTGMTAGVGLSGDLANPRKSIPQGTIAATIVGMLAYVAIVIKLSASAPVADLASDQLIMSRIALWGPIIPIGLAAATLSSAIGSILVAPRTLQALSADRSIPWSFNSFLSTGVGKGNEPRNATIVTGVLALAIVLLGNVDFVARLISMFFMVTYGAICSISFLEHFAANPSYRPSFKSRWYISLFGAVMCVLMMFQMDPVFAVVALLVMAALYFIIARSVDSGYDLAGMFSGVFSQLTRKLNIRLQNRRNQGEVDEAEWRPSIIMVNDRTFDRKSPLELLRWLSHRHGFGTYLHFIKGLLNPETGKEASKIKDRMVKLAVTQKSPVYMDAVVSPSMTSALAQALQIPGVSGLANNTVLFEFSDRDPKRVTQEVVDLAKFASGTKMNLLVMRHSDVHFGERKSIHIWLTWNDERNANLMVLLSYIILGHPDWKDAEIRLFAALPSDEEVSEKREAFKALMEEGRIPISPKNIRFIPVDDRESFKGWVKKFSQDADLTMIGFDLEGLEKRGADVFLNHSDISDLLFVYAPKEISIK